MKHLTHTISPLSMGEDEGWVCDGAEVTQFRTERYGDTVFSPGIIQSYFLCSKRTILLLESFGRLKKWKYCYTKNLLPLEKFK